MGVDALIVGRSKYEFGPMFGLLSQALGRSVSRSIDMSTPPISDPQQIVSALATFEQASNLTVREQMREAEHELFFVHYVFLMYSDKSTADTVREWTKLDITSATAVDGGIIFFAAGTLSEWKRAIMECCSEKAAYNLRLLFDKVVLKLEAEGCIFPERKVMLNDKTFLLE